MDAFTDGNPIFTRDGRRVVFSSNRDGLPQLYVADVATPEAPPRRVLTTTERIPGGQPLGDGKTVLFRSDHGADENWSLFLCGLDGSGLTELTKGVKMQRDDPTVPDGMPTTAFYSARVISEVGSSAYSVELAAGAREKKLYEEKLPGFLSPRIAVLRLSPDGARVTRTTVLESRTSFTELPTTGAVVGDDFYFIANSQVDNERDGSIVDPGKLASVRIGVVRLPD